MLLFNSFTVLIKSVNSKVFLLNTKNSLNFSQVMFFSLPGPLVVLLKHLQLSSGLMSKLQVIDLTAVTLPSITFNSEYYLIYTFFSFKIANYITLLSPIVNKRISKLPLDLVPNSLSYLFSSYWWLEREVSELFNVVFDFKRDSRNLLLEYTNTAKPLEKLFPVFGIFEIYFDTISSTVKQCLCSLQV